MGIVKSSFITRIGIVYFSILTQDTKKYRPEKISLSFTREMKYPLSERDPEEYPEDSSSQLSFSTLKGGELFAQRRCLLLCTSSLLSLCIQDEQKRMGDLFMRKEVVSLDPSIYYESVLLYRLYSVSEMSFWRSSHSKRETRRA
jgi:hypothetical protein